MGGFGSGRDEYATTPTVEECRHIDADTIKELTEHRDARATISWGDRDDPDTTIAVFTEGDAGLEGDTRPARLRFKYTTTNTRTDESTGYDYTVAIDYTECNFGGYRPWFRCPKCYTRRGKLYLPPGRKVFRCRECYDLGYTSSRTSGDELKQAELRYRRAFAKADKDNRRPHPNGEPYTPERPKGMHHDTFDELMTDVWEASEGWHDKMRKRELALLEQLRDVRDTYSDPIASTVDE